MGEKKKADGRSAFHGHDAPTVAGGRRLVAAYMADGDYQALRALCERRGVSVSSFVGAAASAAVRRAK
jgi:hypothetical protein